MRGMTELHVVHTADLDPGTLADARALLDAAFDGEFSDDDWEHALGGLHMLVREGAELIGHASVVQRRLLHLGRALRAGYVEAVAVRAGHRHRGHGTALMAAVERAVRSGYELGALSSADDAVGFYTSRGWRRWRGRTSALTPAGMVRTEDDDGGVFVLPVHHPLDLDGELACDWRDGDLW
ncbi:GNAT family N-acetyltransferase [Marinactinospora rubrisoli]|uniref:GNAT family N-acetyltransferase n=1 Tax=Marinactinospora rubrisoli TaxID=2715399 RepID=A0ABW2KM27_9ACTN